MSRKALLGILLAVLLPVLCYVVVKQASERAVGMPGRFFADSVITVVRQGKQMTDTVWHSVADIRGKNQDGRAISLSQLNGKVAVIDFFFTRCPSICPALTASLKKLQDGLMKTDPVKPADTPFVQFISFSVDPERDSVPALKRYADKFGVNPEWWWLVTGSKKEIYDFSINELKLGLQDGEGVDSNFIHTQKVTLLDRNRVVRGYYNGLDSVDMARLASDIVFIMLEKDRSKPSPLVALRPLIPVFAIIVLATVGLILYLGRKPKHLV